MADAQPHTLPVAANPSVVVATEPLGDAACWTAFAPGELRLYQDGLLLRRILTVF